MPQQSAKPKQFRFLLWSWYDTTRLEPRTQNPNLGFEELKLGVVSRSAPLQSQRQDKEKEPFHTRSFRSNKPKRRRINTVYHGAYNFDPPGFTGNTTASAGNVVQASGVL